MKNDIVPKEGRAGPEKPSEAGPQEAPLKEARPKEARIEEFVQLFTSHEVRLRAFAMSMIPNYTDAEDVLQQANLLLWKRFDQFEPGTSFMSWAGRVVYFAALQHRRKQGRDKVQFGDAFFSALTSVATRDDVAAKLGDRERVLGECVSKLKAEHREMLRVRYAESGSIEQMTVLFNRSAEAIYNVLSRIRRVLHDCVDGKLNVESLTLDRLSVRKGRETPLPGNLSAGGG